MEDDGGIRFWQEKGQEEETTKEVWLPVIGYESSYSVSNKGRIRSEKRTRVGKGGKPVAVNERMLKQTKDKDGYLKISLCRNNERSRAFVHAVVLESHVCARPAGMQACHNNGNPSDNRVSNLRWGTAKSNQMDRLAHGTDCRGQKNGTTKLNDDLVRKIRNDSRRLTEIAKDYGVDRSTIGLIMSRKTWAHVEE